MKFQWSDLKFFLELVRAGSPLAASKRLGTDHTTVRRRVRALEEALKAKMFSSRGKAYELTSDGERLFKYAEAVEALMLRAQESVTNSDLAESGTVRVGTTEGFGGCFLASRLGRLADANPDLQIQLVNVSRVIKLSNREADLAIALSKPSQLRQIVRKLCDFTVSIYASPDYLDRSPPIRSLADLTDHRFVGYVPDLLEVPELDFLPEINQSLSAHFEASSIHAQLAAVASGAGLCAIPDFVAATEPRLVCVLPDEFRLVRSFWLAIHPEMINLARVRAVIDFLVELVNENRALLDLNVAEALAARSLPAPNPQALRHGAVFGHA